jgi:predicted aspartyl protease
MRFLGLFVSAGLLAAPYAIAAPDCALKKVASFDASAASGSLLIDAQIDGKKVRAVLDTGSPYNLISKKLADELKLPKLSTVGFKMIDAAGKEGGHMTKAHTVTAGDLKTEDVPFLIAGEDATGGSSMQILFGNAFLEANDLELDLAHGKVICFCPIIARGRSYIGPTNSCRSL